MVGKEGNWSSFGKHNDEERPVKKKIIRREYILL